MQTSTPIEERLTQLEEKLGELAAERDEAGRQRDEYRRLYLQMLELNRKLERGILGPKRERFVSGEDGLTMSLLGMLVPDASPPSPDVEAAAPEPARASPRAKPTGRKSLPEKLPRVDLELLPPEVQAQGLDAFERIGEDVSETVERRPASLVVVRLHKPKFVLKQRDKLDSTDVLQAPPAELPIPGGLAGPGLLADTVVRRWQDHLPLHRLERIYGREGLPLARSTVCGWHAALATLVRPLLEAMWKDALTAPYLCTDATGVLVQASPQCRRGHFWVVAAPEKHVLFAYSPRHDSDAVDELLKGYQGYLVADAHAVYDHLFKAGDVVECGCLAHARRYFFKALETDPERARYALALLGSLFRLERTQASASPEKRLEVRRREGRPLLESFFTWCDAQAPLVLDGTPIARALGYARNQRQALSRFLEDGRLPMHNNFSERELRREAVGRRNWLFLGSDEAGEVNTTFVTLLASCQLHGIEPLGYLRDLFCLLPNWPVKRVLELAPACWKQTLQQQDAQERLAADLFRQVSLGALTEHRPPE
jgi:transposase